MTRQYRAFISYSHADERWAAWLQRKLESYRVPKRLQGAEKALPARLHPVFRDKEELASSGDLGDSIQDALSRSAALVLVCSPAAAASRWVNEEVLLFRRTFPDRPVLCCMVAGSPDPQAEDCAFPPALLVDDQGNALPEPLAADLRKTADGPRGALLKIIAGLLGVGIDDLRQRDQQRKMKLLAAAAGAACLVSIVTIGLAIAAQLARQEADLRRAQAEGLIDFMLVELRDKLEPIGKLDVLDAVGDQATEYFAALGDRGTESEVLSRAMALRQIGEVRFDQGRLEPALAAFKDSLAINRRLHEAYPDNDEYLFELGQAEFWVGYVAWERSDLSGASGAFERYMEHTRALQERSPDDPDVELELMYAYSNLGSVALEAGRTEDALGYFDRSVAISRAFAEASPDDAAVWDELTDGLSWRGSALIDLGRLSSARENNQATAEAAQRALEIEATPHRRHLWVSGMLQLSRVLAHLGLADEALQTLQATTEAALELVAFDEENAYWRRNAARIHFFRAELLLIAQDFDGFAEQLQLARAVTAPLSAGDQASNYDLSLLALFDRIEAEAALQQGDPDRALQLSAAAWAAAQEVLADAEMKFVAVDAAQIAETRARLLLAAGRPGEAAVVLKSALSGLPPAEDSALLQAVVRLQLLLLQDPDPAPIALLRGRLEEAGFSDPRFQIGLSGAMERLP